MSEAPKESLEHEIAAIVERRDREAFARLFAFYAPRIKAYLCRQGVDRETAEDLAQEAMLAVWRRAHQYDPSRAALSTWIYTIARNKRIDALRRERRPDFDINEPSLQPSPSPRGDDTSEIREVNETVADAVDDLPSEQAEILRIFYFEDKTHQAIAEDLGLPLGTVKSRLRLAIHKLRSALEGLVE